MDNRKVLITDVRINKVRLYFCFFFNLCTNGEQSDCQVVGVLIGCDKSCIDALVRCSLGHGS